jgi:hypothetical protein
MSEQPENATAINDILNEFYQLKEKYEKTYYEKYVKKIIRTTNKSNKEKKREYAKLPKPECINCKRNVGTIFLITQDAEELRRNFSIKCGDISDPCPLDIKFYYGNRVPYDSEIRFQTESLNKLKDRIVLEKNNTIFGYNSPDVATDIFNYLTDELKTITDITGFLIEKNLLVNENPAKKELIYKLQDELQKEYITPYKEFIYKFIHENNIDYCKEAVQLYVNEIIPKLKEIQNLKYEINHVEYNNDNNTFHLMQYPNSLDNLQYQLSSYDEIISSVKGVKYKSSQKTKKSTVSSSSRAKTLKIKPTIEIIEEEEPIQEQEIDTDVPTYTESGVIWSKPDYIQLWNSMPKDLQKFLMSEEFLVDDKEYLQDYMKNCIASKRKREPCKLRLPKQTYFPPKYKNGYYDFGSQVVNNLFNNLRDNYKETLVTVYTEKNGVRNYDELKEILISLLEKDIANKFSFEFGFNPGATSSSTKTY